MNDELKSIEKLIEDRFNTLSREIQELKLLIAKNSNDGCVDGLGHFYPSIWHATVPPHCSKCGQQAPNNEIRYAVGVGGWGVPNSVRIPDGESSDAAGYDFSKFGGNLITNQLELFPTQNSIVEINSSPTLRVFKLS